MKSSLAWALIALLATLAPGVASAQTETDAREAFDRGRAAMAESRFEDALAEFRSSLAALASPNSRLMVARALVGLGRSVEAREEMRRAELDAAARAPTEPRYEETRAAAASEGADLDRGLARVRLHVSGQTLASLVVVVAHDAEHTGERSVEMTDGLFWVVPGPTYVSVQGPDEQRAQAEFVASAGDVHELVLTLSAPVAPEPPPEVAIEAPVLAPLPSPVDTGGHVSAFAPVGWISLGLGAASLIAFGALYATTDASVSHCAMVGCTSSEISDVYTTGTLTNVFFVAGLVLVPVGVAGLIAAQLDSGSVTFALGPMHGSMRVVF